MSRASGRQHDPHGGVPTRSTRPDDQSPHQSGNLASITSRFSEYRTIYASSPTHLVGHGLTKPLLGVILALFLAVVINADLIPLQEGGSRPALSMAFAFIAGFSERFARDVAGRVEGLAGGTTASQLRQP